MPYLRLPDGSYADVPKGMSYEEALDAAKRAYPKLYADPSKAKEGLIPSTKSGVEALLSSYGTAFAPLLGMPEESVRKQVERSQARRGEIAKAPDWKDVTEAYEKYRLFGGEKPEERGALSSLLGMWRGQLGESLPQIGAVAAGARVGAGLGSMAGPVGTLAGGALGALAASYPAFVGQNIERQIEEQEKAKEKKPLEWGRAAAAAAPQAALDVAETAFVLGRLGMGKLLTNSLPKLGAAKAEEELVKASQRSLAKAAGRGVVAGEVTEIPTELAQQVLERWQAGLSLFDEDAKKEYIETAVGVAGPAGVLGGAGGVSARSQARDQLQQVQEARAAQDELQKQAAQQAAQQQAEQQAQARAAQTQQIVEEPFAVGPQGRLFEGEASALPVGQSMQALYAQLKKAEADGDTRTASILRNDINRLTAQLNNPDLLRQQRDALEEEKNKLTEQLGAVAAVDPVKAKELYQRGLTVNNQIKQVEALLKQLPQQRTAKQIESLQKRFAAAREVDDQEKMLTLGAQLAEEGPRTGDLLAGVPLLPGELPSERARRELGEEIEAGYVGEQPPVTLTPEPQFIAQQKLEAQDRARAQKEEDDARENLEKIEERRMKGLPKTGKEPTIATATSPREVVFDEVVFEPGAEREVPAQFGYTPPLTIPEDKAKEKEAALLTKLGAELGVVEGEKPLNVAQLRLQQKEHAQEKESALFDMATTVDSLRKNDTRDTKLNKNVMQFGFAEGQRRNAFEAKNKVIDSLIKEINSFRDQYDVPHLTKEQENKIKAQVDQKFDPIIERAQPDITQQGGVLHDALQVAIDKKIKEVKARAKDPTKRAGIKALIEELNQLRAKQNAIPRGVSFSKERAAKEYGTIPEFTSWQRFINKVAFDYSPKPVASAPSKRRVVSGTPESIVQATMRRPSEKVEVKKETEARGEKETTLSEELAKSRKYALSKVKNILSTRTLDKETKSVFQQVEERLESERGTRELLKEIYEAISRIAIGQKADIAPLQKALKTEEEVIQTGEQGELFVEKGREERAPAQMLTSVKRATPSSFAKFAAAIRKRTDEAVVAFINKQNLPEKINALEKDIAYLDKKVAELFGTRLDAAVNRLFNLAKKQTALTLGDTSFKSKWEKLFSSKKWTSTNDIINARLKLQETDFLNKLENLVKNVESSKANKIIVESKEWLEDKELFQQFFNESGFFDLKKWNKALKTELRLRSIGPQGLATQQVNADFARNLKALESAKEALDSLKTNVNALTKAGVLKYSFGPHIGEFKQINNASLIQDIKTATERIEKNIELRRINNAEAQRRATKQQDLQKAQEAVKKAAESVRTFETEFVPVKTAPKNTELGKIQDEIVETQNKIFALGAELNIQPRKKGSAKTKQANLHSAYLRVDIDPNLIRTSKQRSLNNQRLGFIEKRAKLLERMVMRRMKITTQTAGDDVVEKTPNFEQAYAIASRVLPNKHAILTSQLTEVRERLKDKEQTKARIKSLEERRTALNQQLLEVEESAKKFGINLAGRVFSSEDTARAQQKAMREMEAAEGREGKKIPLTLKIAKNPEEETSQQSKKRKGRLSPDEIATSYGFTSPEDVKAFQQSVNDERQTDFRDASSADSGVDTKAAADVAARITKALPSGINVVYAPTLKDAPPAFLGALYRSGKTTAKGAVLPDGTVVVVGEAHKNTADLEETFAHELIGHYGVDMVLGPERMQALTDRLFKQGEDHVAQVATALGVFPDIETALAAKDALKNKDVQMSIAREMIAHAAEGRRVVPTFSEKVKTFVRDMIAAVRAWFRSAGLSDLAKQDAKEIQKLIREASDSLAAGQRSVYVSPDGKVVFRGGEAQYPTGFSAESRQLTDALIYKEKGVVDNVKANLLGLTGMTQFVDRLAPVWAALKQGVATKKISELEAAQVRYDLSVYDKSMNFTRLVASQGALEFKKKGSGAGAYWMVEPKEADPKKAATLVKMFEALKEAGLEENATGNMFTIWLGAQRVKNEGVGVEKLNFGKDAQGNSIVTEAKLAQIEREIAAMPKVKNAFEKARGIYNEYNKGLVDFAEQSGAISKEVADSLRAKKDYIPFYRPDPDGNVQLVIGDEVPFTIGNLRDQPYLHELVGGNTAISNIFTSSVQNTHLMTQMALRNIATGGVVDALRKLGMLDTRKYTDKETGKEKEALRVSGALTGTDTIRFKKDGEDIAVRVANTDGTIFEGINPSLLVKGLEGVTTTMPAMLKLMGIPTQLLRRAVILSPMYPIRQIIKDSFSVLGTSGANFIPVIDPFKNVYKAMTGTSREAQLLERQGLLGGQILAGPNTKENLSTILRGIVSGKQDISSMLAWAEAKSMEADVGVRLSAYNSFLKQGLNEMEAWIATNEIIDFNRRGVSPSVQWANTLYPFFSAQVQGLNVFIKAMTGNMPYNERLKIQEKFKQRAMAMAAMTIAYAMAMEDDEAYANATPEQKLNNWFVRVPFFDEPLRIPIPFEFGLLAKAIPEAIYTGLAGKEDFEPVAKALLVQIANSLPAGSSKLMPQALLPAAEAITGKDWFTLADVESPKMKTLDPSERYKENTTELAKLLGSAGIPGMSPVKIDQFIKGVGSQTLLAAVSLGDAFLESSEKPKPEKKASQLAVFGSAFQPTDAGGIINRTYELMQEGERAVNTYNKLLEEGEEAKAKAYLDDNMARISVGEMYGEFKASMKQIKDEMDYVRKSDDSPAKKREQLDLLRKQQIDVAKDYRNAIRQAE